MTTPRLANDCFALPPGVEWTPVDQALALLKSRLHAVVGPEDVVLAKASGRVVATDLKAVRTSPPSTNSAVDGYGIAIASCDRTTTTQRLALLAGRAAAGHPFQGKVAIGKAVRILTGATVPAGVDTILMQEDVEVDDDCISFSGLPRTGANLRAAGEDMKEGATIFPAGTVLRAKDVGVLAAAGLAEIASFRRLRVGVLSTGDEIRAAGDTASADQIFDANRPMLLSMLARWGFAAVDLGHVGDTRDLVRARLDEAVRQVDAILTSGGASAGDEDHMSAILQAEGQVDFWRIAIKPGRPLAMGQWQGVPLFGLPGNPVAAFVCALIFARPALFLMAGARWPEPVAYRVPAAFGKKKKPGRREYLRARLNAEGQAEVFWSEGSGLISGLSWSDGLVELGDAGDEITPGAPVRFIPYASFGL